MEKIFPDMWIFITIRGNNGMVLFSSSLSPSNNKMDTQQSISTSGVCYSGQSGRSTVDVWPIGAMNTPVAILHASSLHVCGDWGILVFPRYCNNSKLYKTSHGFLPVSFIYTVYGLIAKCKHLNLLMYVHGISSKNTYGHKHNTEVSMLDVKSCEQLNRVLIL